MKLSGHEAIDYAEAHSLTLNKYTDPQEGAKDGLTVAEAREIAQEDASLIYLETPTETPAGTIDITPESLKTPEGAEKVSKAMQEWQSAQAELANRAAEWLDNYGQAAKKVLAEDDAIDELNELEELASTMITKADAFLRALAGR